MGAYLRACQARGLSPRTLEHYRWALAPLASLPEVPSRPGELEDLLAGLAGGRETRRCYFRVWRAFYRWAVRRFDLANPMGELTAPRGSRRPPRALDQAVLPLLLSTAVGRERALVAVMLDTGIRLGEVAGLTAQAVGEDLVRVEGKTGHRDVPVTAWVRDLLRAWLPWGVGPKSLYLDVKRALARVGVATPRSGPHLLRHTFARLYILAGGDAFSLQHILGHASLGTTRVYVDLSPREVLAQHRRFSPLAGVPAPGLAPRLERELREALG